MKTLILLLLSSVCFAQNPVRTGSPDGSIFVGPIYSGQTKTAHGFTVGEWLTVDENGAYVNGSDTETQEFIGIVSWVSTNTFAYVPPGWTINTLSGLTAGERYYAQNDGTIGLTPTAKPVGIATSTTTLVLLAGNYGTTIPPPSDQAGLPTFSNITSTSATISFNAGNGDGRLVLIGSITELPSNNVFYTANTVFSSGDAIGSAYVVLASDATSVNVTGLTASTSYQCVVFEYSSSGFFITYNTSTGTDGFTTLASGTTPTTQFTTNRITPKQTQLRIQGTRGNGDLAVTVASTEGQPDTDPADASDPTPGNYGAGTALGNGYVVHEAVDHDFHINGFTRDRMVWWKIMERENTGFLYNTQATIDSAWTSYIYDSLFVLADWTIHQTVGFTATTVSDTLNLSGNPAGFQDYILRDEILPDTLEEIIVSYTFKISGALSSSTVGTGPIMLNDLTSEANRAVFVLFVTNTASANFGKLQIYTGNGTVSATDLSFRSQSSGAFVPAQNSTYTIILTRTIENSVNAFYTARIIDLYDSAELTTSYTEPNAPSSEFIGTSTQVGIWQNGGPFKVNPFSVTRVGLDDIIPPSGGGPFPVQYEVFVEKSGSDANDCSEASPCLTAVRAAARVNELGVGAQPDVYFGPGTYTETSFVLWPAFTDTLDGAGDTQTIFKGASNLYTDISTSGNGSPFSQYGYLFNFNSNTTSTDVITVMRNFSMEGNRNVGGYDNSMKGGILINNRDQINMIDVDVKYFWGTGVWAMSVDSLVLRSCHLQQNSFSNPAPQPSITYSLGNLQLFGTTTRIWVIDCFIDSPILDQGQGIQHSGAPNFFRVDLHVHRGTIDVGNSTDAQDHHFAAEILYYFMNAGDSITFQNVLLKKNLSLNYTGAELGTHFIHGNTMDLSSNNKNLGIEAQVGNLEVCHNYFSGIIGKVIGTYNSWNTNCPRDCNAANQVWDGMNIHHNVVELVAANLSGDAIFGDQNWRRDDVTIQNNTIQFTTTSGQIYRFIRGGTQGVNDNWIVQNNAIHGQPSTGSTVFSTANNSTTFTNSFFRYNKATNLVVTQLLSGDGMSESNNTVTGSGNTLGFNLTGSHFPVVNGSFWAWPTGNTVLKNTGYPSSPADIGAYED